MTTPSDKNGVHGPGDAYAEWFDWRVKNQDAPPAEIWLAAYAAGQASRSASVAPLREALKKAQRGFENLADYVLQGPYKQECREAAEAIHRALSAVPESEPTVTDDIIRRLLDKDQIVMGGLIYCGPVMRQAAEELTRWRERAKAAEAVSAEGVAKLPEPFNSLMKSAPTQSGPEQGRKDQ